MCFDGTRRANRRIFQHTSKYISTAALRNDVVYKAECFASRANATLVEALRGGPRLSKLASGSECLKVKCYTPQVAFFEQNGCYCEMEIYVLAEALSVCVCVCDDVDLFWE